jgi:1,4-alpha-glucan branching enzyme
MFKDELLMARYLDYVDRQIEFGAREMDRIGDDPQLRDLAQFYYDRAVEKRILFTERYESNILKILDMYQKKGRLELITTAASHAFLPLYASYPEAVQAQMELAIASHRGNFGRNPQGFWLPELGWTEALDHYLRSYNFSYTVIDTHGALLGEPRPRRGSFYPLRTPSKIFVLVRDFYALGDIFESRRGYCSAPQYRDNFQDAGFELPSELVRSFLGDQGGRIPTGYKYRFQGNGETKSGVYDPKLGAELAREPAKAFLEARLLGLNKAAELMEESPLSLLACDADDLGRFWYEGPLFLEALFREAAARKSRGQEELQIMTPVEYLFKQNAAHIETSTPGFSSWGLNGYGEMWLDASNDWMYRHSMQALDRMVELAERFPNDSGLKERALNQAAREILVLQSSDWPRMLCRQEFSEFARHQIEMALRNFTTIYEALGSNYISTEWLTNLEKRHNLFPHINYRIFRRKH